MHRRSFLSTATGASVALLAGCLEAVDELDVDRDTLADLDGEAIGVEIDRESDARDATGPVADALSFWDEHSEQYTGYDIGYTRDTSDPLLTIHLTDTVETCGIAVGEIFGCADLVEDELPEHLSATIEASLTDRGVYEMTVHEVGHTLGLTHGDEPQYYMQPVLPEPWERPTTRVYLPDTRPTDDIMAGLAYLADEADGVNGQFTRADDRNAGLVVEQRPSACGEGFVACTALSEVWRDQTIIRLDRTLDDDVVAWHVASLIAELAGDVPPVLHPDTGRAVRSSQWWNRTGE